MVGRLDWMQRTACSVRGEWVTLPMRGCEMEESLYYTQNVSTYMHEIIPNDASCSNNIGRQGDRGLLTAAGILCFVEAAFSGNERNNAEGQRIPKCKVNPNLRFCIELMPTLRHHEFHIQQDRHHFQLTILGHKPCIGLLYLLSRHGSTAPRLGLFFVYSSDLVAAVTPTRSACFSAHFCQNHVWVGSIFSANTEVPVFEQGKSFEANSGTS